MTDLSGYVLEMLRDGGEFALYRGRQHGNPSPILVLAPVAEQPVPAILARLEHEYGFAAELDPEWAARPLAIARREGRTMLVLEDGGGEPLDGALERPLEAMRFLQLAVGMAAALGQVHRHDLVHKDIKPANVLVDAVGNVRLTGFGFASRLPRERLAPAPPEVIAGTLAYMAPEQTGRMNRSIDARSDLYSLGVTFYEMLTGTLPFMASDPMEWVHCHIARQPVPPEERATAVPAQLSSIVMKLLAKTAEERYQTAAGLAADLRRCQADWEARGRIAPFPLGTQDVPDRLLMPERLYGREREIDALLASFDRVVANGTPELVLVSGYSGIGKSSVVNELHKALVPPRGLFAAGKFDQYKRDIPYATLAQAFQTLVHQILAKNEAGVSDWRYALEEALGPNGQLIVSLIPELELVIGKQPPVPDLPPQDAQIRFQTVFRRFLGVFARPDHPLTLFLDDLQWLDTATLELLEHLVTDPEVRHLLLIGAYRDNEVGPSHPLMRMLAAIRKAGARVEEIVLAPLVLGDLGRLVADSLHGERNRAQPLAQLVHEKTGGNPFFAIQFLTALAEEELLVFDAGLAAWTWELASIRAKGYTDNVVDLMAGKLNRLPEMTQEALKQLACLGNVAEIAALTLVRGGSEEEIHKALWEAVRSGLVFRLDHSYAFLHDRVQEAAYSLIPEGQRAAAHLRVGRLLVSRTASEEIEEKIFEILNQFDRGAELITSAAERERVAELNLMGGVRAKASTAYASALTYLSAGRALLEEDSWERRYPLTFALEFHRAECELLTADMAAAEERLSMLSSRAVNLVDIAAVASLRLTLYTTLDRSDSAVEVCLEYLRRVGVRWSPHPTKHEVWQEYQQIKRRLGSRSIEELVDLPLMHDQDRCATMDVLTQVVTPALFTDENLLCLVICRMANLSLEHGNSDGSCFAYVWLGMILGPHFGDYQAGFRFGRLGCDLVEKSGLDRFKARVFMSFGNLVNPWTRHITTGRALVQRAVDTANKIGDLTFAAYSWNNLITNLLASGDPLGDVQREAENGLEFARKVRFGLVIDIITGQLRLIRTLRGLTPDFSSFNDAEFDEGGFEQHLEADPRLALPACWYWIRKLQARFYAGDHASALAAASKAEPLLWTSPSFFEVAEYHFYGALARAIQHDAASTDERGHNLQALAVHHKQLELWAESCPENFRNRAALVAAEIARIEGRELDAERLYEAAIRAARENGFIQNEGVANELAARFYTARGFETIAHAYIRNARYCYLRWGAVGKVRQLDQRYPQLHEEHAPASLTATIGAPVEQLDVVTVVKASQALSSEIVLGTLIETLMRIAVEHAGADRSLLILLRNDEPYIAAEAMIGRGRIDVTLRQAAITPSELPESVFRYVIRTRESVILDDASVRNLFTEDEYVRQRRPKSVLCLPIVEQAKLVGALYLENSLTPRAFTSERTAVLELLASQAAISLENARLYSDLEQENTERKRAEEGLRRSEALLTQAQEISQTGSWRWNVGSGELSCSKEHFRIFGFDPATAKPSYSLFMQRVHPDDQPLLAQIIEQAIREKSAFDCDFRIIRPDGSVKFLHSVAQSFVDQSGNLEFIGTVMDITERKRAEEALRNAQADLARVARLTTMGELAASIAHEVNQPLMAIVTNADTCLAWLANDRPDLDEAREAAERVVRDGHRAGEVIRTIRSLARKSGPEMTQFNIDDAIREILVLMRSELRRHHVSLETELSAGIEPVTGDRVQLQQVVLNLIMNGIEAMSATMHDPRVLRVNSQIGGPNSVMIAVTDTGPGLDPTKMDRIFDAFFTTKPQGMGMGLSICRSIVEAHGGRLWASPHVPHGTIFRFTVPPVADRGSTDSAE